VRLFFILGLFSLVGCQQVLDDKGDTSDLVDSQPIDDGDDGDDLDTGLVDTGTVDTAPPVDSEYDLSVVLTADDAWVLWVNDQRIAEAEGWKYTDIQDTTVSLFQDGEHVIAIHAYDVHGVISGLLAAISLDGIQQTVTGDGQWRMSKTQPATNWTRAQFDDSTWDVPVLVNDTDVSYYWKNQPSDIMDLGAEWVWDGNPRGLQDVWFRYVFTIP
jgi:hypothetical protein